MVTLVALDVAILPPPEVMARAIAYSAALPAASAERLELDAAHLPHITLTQLFVRHDELDTVGTEIDDVLADQQPLDIQITGGGQSGRTVWLTVERSAELLDLHRRLMASLRGLERGGGDTHAFFDGSGRVGDVRWVAGFRQQSSFRAFTPHITLGHGERAPEVEPFQFEAVTVAACHLGRFCTCRRILRAWDLRRVRESATVDLPDID